MDPVLGRFTQADTIIPNLGNPLAMDRYAYTTNNPVKYVDPSGHWGCGVECTTPHIITGRVHGFEITGNWNSDDMMALTNAIVIASDSYNLADVGGNGITEIRRTFGGGSTGTTLIGGYIEINDSLVDEFNTQYGAGREYGSWGFADLSDSEKATHVILHELMHGVQSGSGWAPYKDWVSEMASYLDYEASDDIDPNMPGMEIYQEAGPRNFYQDLGAGNPTERGSYYWVAH